MEDATEDAARVAISDSEGRSASNTARHRTDAAQTIDSFGKVVQVEHCSRVKGDARCVRDALRDAESQCSCIDDCFATISVQQRRSAELEDTRAALDEAHGSASDWRVDDECVASSVSTSNQQRTSTGERRSTGDGGRACAGFEDAVRGERRASSEGQGERAADAGRAKLRRRLCGDCTSDVRMNRRAGASERHARNRGRGVCVRSVGQCTGETSGVVGRVVRTAEEDATAQDSTGRWSGGE